MMLLDEIGVEDVSKGFKLVDYYGDKQICCDGVRFDISFACDLLNELYREKENWKISSCNSMNIMSVLSMDSQIVLEEIFKLEKEVDCSVLLEKFMSMMKHLRGEF